MANKKKTASALKTQLFARVLLIIIGTLSFAYGYIHNKDQCSGQLIYADKNELCAKLADDANERTKGLAGIKILGSDEVMLFIFDNIDYHGIWMKNMEMPIDIIWLDENKRVVWIEKNINPSSYPRVYYPASPSKFIIETPEGLSTKLNLTINHQFSW